MNHKIEVLKEPKLLENGAIGTILKFVWVTFKILSLKNAIKVDLWSLLGLPRTVKDSPYYSY